MKNVTGKRKTVFVFLMGGLLGAGMTVAVDDFSARAMSGQPLTMRGERPEEPSEPRKENAEKGAATKEPQEKVAEVDSGKTSLLRETSESFRRIAREVSPAVVNIQATRKAEEGQGRQPEIPPGFQEFFERFGSPFPFTPNPSPQTSLGSGFFVRDGEYIVTNNHVVDNASKIVVRVGEAQEELEARIVGVDPATDLAVLKLKKPYQPEAFLTWADMEEVSVGDWSVAIGSPFALTNTLTVGVISAKGRSGHGVTGSQFIGELIQTDTAINPGNSGGPLCDIQGRVVGVNTAIFTNSGGYMGIGFAVPANVGQNVVNELIAHGKVVRGWLGVSIQPAPKELTDELELEGGVLVHSVVPDSPSAKAGIRPGDVIVSVGGTNVTSPAELQKQVSGLAPGKEVQVQVVNYETQKRRSLDVRIGTMPTQVAE